MDKAVLVTGGTGFLGAYLLRELLEKGYTNISALKRKRSKMDLVNSFQNQIKWIEADILDVFALEEAMEGKEEVYHCAGFVSHLKKDVEKMMLVNVEGTSNVINAALDQKVKKFLHVSSIAAIGRIKDGDTIDENSKWERSDLNSQYAISKFLSEQEAWRGMAEGLQIVVINPSVILGSGFWDTGTASFFRTVWKGLKFYTTGTSGYVDVRDVAKMSVELMESEFHSERFVCTGENITYQKLFSTIAKSIGKPAPIIKVNPLLREVAWRVEWLKSLVGFTPIVTKETARHSSRSFFYKNDKSVEKLNFRYTSIEKCIEDAGAVFLKNKNGNDWKPAMMKPV